VIYGITLLSAVTWSASSPIRHVAMPDRPTLSPANFCVFLRRNLLFGLYLFYICCSFCQNLHINLEDIEEIVSGLQKVSFFKLSVGRLLRIVISVTFPCNFTVICATLLFLNCTFSDPRLHKVQRGPHQTCWTERLLCSSMTE